MGAVLLSLLCWLAISGAGQALRLANLSLSVFPRFALLTPVGPDLQRLRRLQTGYCQAFKQKGVIHWIAPFFCVLFCTHFFYWLAISGTGQAMGLANLCLSRFHDVK